MSIIIAGIEAKRFPQSKNPDLWSAELKVLYPLGDLTLEKIERVASGTTTDVPFGKTPITVNSDYAKKLIKSRAFVPNKDYELKFSFSDETFENEVTELIPCDPQVAKHFEESLKAYKG